MRWGDVATSAAKQMMAGRAAAIGSFPVVQTPSRARRVELRTMELIPVPYPILVPVLSWQQAQRVLRLAATAAGVNGSANVGPP